MYSDYSDSDAESVASQASRTGGGNKGHGKTGRGRTRANKTQSSSQESAAKDFILQRGGTVSCSELQQQTFYTDDRDVEEWLRTEPGRYLVKRNLKGKVQSVTAIVKVRLCYDFTHSRCKFGNGCKNIHVCKAFLEGDCSRETCKFPHGFQSVQGKKVVKAMGLDGLSDDTIRQVIRGSLPEVCTFYNSPNGCRDNTLCSNLHICKDFIKRSCEGDCTLSHDFAEPHNESVLQKHFMSCRMPKNILQYSVILSPATGEGKRCEGAVGGNRGRGRGRGRGGRGGVSRAKSTENLSLNSSSARSLHCSMESLNSMGRKEAPRGGRGRGRGGRGRGKKIQAGNASSSSSKATPTVAPSELDIFESLCSDHEGSEKLNRLWQLEFRQHGFDFDQTESWFRQRPNKFRLYENDKGELEVCVMHPKARLCFSYTTQMGCKKGDDCPFFHVCRYFLLGSCHHGPKCKFFHNLQSEQAEKVIDRLQLDSLEDEEIFNIIRNSSPKVCQAYNSHSCLKAESCLDIHICSEFVRGRCTEATCDLNHESCFDTPQTREILEGFRMANTDQRAVIKTLLIPPTATPQQHVSKVTQATVPKNPVASVPKVSETEIFETICCDHDGRETLNRLWQLEFQQHGFDFEQTAAWFRHRPNKFRLYENDKGELEVCVMHPKARLCFSHTTQMGCQKGDDCPFFHVCRNFLLGSCHHGPKCKFSHDLGSRAAERLGYCLSDEIILNIIRKSSPKVCQAYNTHSCLKAESCPDIHICSEFVRGCCTEATCDLNHESCFDTPQTRKILEGFRMANTDQRAVIKTLLIPPTTKPQPRVSKVPQATPRPSVTTPKVLPTATSPVQVVKPKATAPQAHVPRATPATVPKNPVPRTVRPPTPGVTTPEGQPSVATPVQVVKPKATAPDPNEERILDNDTSICEDFLAGTCLKSRLCECHHVKRSYLWQYQDLQNQGGEWVSFSPEVIVKMEEAFCQPSNVIFNLSDIETRLNGWTVDFDKMKLEISNSYPRKHVRLRRLSTPSSVESSGGALSTKWLWYWENNGSWCEYGNSIKPGTLASITSDEIERAYLTKQPTYKFRTNEYPYILDFTEMYQQNLDPRYFTQRNVRRRPVFVPFHSASRTASHAGSQLSSVATGSLPSTWKPMSPKDAFIRVVLAPSDREFKEVEKQFRQTMTENMIIRQVERVQNPRLWEKYCINKQQMIQKLESRPKVARGTTTLYDERKLFHGTEPTIIKGICHQNFDWRLSGKNATVYGKGSYFAKKASYSHNYSTPAADGTRYMFLANVLVGRYTRGEHNIPRPPPIDPSDPNGELYDSCVDNEYNPSIFVVFNNDQCYPGYLITYTRQADLAFDDDIDPLLLYGWANPSRKLPSGPSLATSAQVGQSSSPPYSSYGRQASSTSAQVGQSSSPPYSSYGRQASSTSARVGQSSSSSSYSSYGRQASPSAHVGPSGYPDPYSYQPYRANVQTPTTQASPSNSRSASPEKKTNCTIQ